MTEHSDTSPSRGPGHGGATRRLLTVLAAVLLGVWPLLNTLGAGTAVAASSSVTGGTSAGQTVGQPAKTPVTRVTPPPATVPAATPTSTPSSSGASSGATVPMLVKFRAGIAPAAVSAAVQSGGGTPGRDFAAIRTQVINVPAARASEIVAAYNKLPSVEHAALAVKFAKATAPNDPGYAQQWALPKIGWDQAYGSVTIAGSAKIAVLDTGVDATQPDLAGRIAAGASEIGGDPNSDPNGHGTEMAGIAAAATNNGTGMAGVAYAGAGIASYQVLGADGTGYDSSVVAGVLDAANGGANVILMAFSSPDYSAALADAVAYAESKGVVVVAATGNAGSTAPSYPAGMPGVIGVASTDQSDNVSASSNTGSAVVAAPGEGIYATQPGGEYGFVSGTSPASAEVAGEAALLIANGDSASQAAAQITGATDPVSGSSFGRIDVAKALGAAVQPGPTSTALPTPTPNPTGTPVYGTSSNTGISGTVFDQNGNPVGGAQIECSVADGCNQDEKTTSNATTGAYSFTLHFGTTNTLLLCATKSGYGAATATIYAPSGASSFTNVDFTLVSGGSAQCASSTSVPNKLAFVTAPQTTTAGVATGTITVSMEDSNGNPIVTDTAVSVSLTSTSTGTVTFSTGTTATIPVGSSSVSFTYTDTQAGTPTISANGKYGTGAGPYGGCGSSGQPTCPITLAQGTQTETITAASANKLAFLQQPSSEPANTTISPAVTVQILDQYGNLTSSTASVTLAIKTGTGTSGATLTGGGSTPASSGTATFSGLSIDKVGTNYQLTATSGVLTSANSSQFNITTRTTSTTVTGCSPNPVNPGFPSICTVTVTDTSSATTSAPTGTVTLSTGGTGTGTFSGSPCTLTGSSSPTTCTATYVPSSGDGGKTISITGTYNPSDSIHATSTSGTYSLTVPNPTILPLLTGNTGIFHGTTTQTINTSFAASAAQLTVNSGTNTFDFYSPPATTVPSMTTSDSGGVTVYIKNTSASAVNITVGAALSDYNPTTGISTTLVNTGFSGTCVAAANSTTACSSPTPNLSVATFTTNDLLHVQIGVTASAAGTTLQYNAAAGSSTYAALPSNRVTSWVFGSSTGPYVTFTASTVNVSGSLTSSNFVTVSYTKGGQAATAHVWDSNSVTDATDVGTTVTFSTTSSASNTTTRTATNATNVFTTTSTSTQDTVQYYQQIANVQFSAVVASGGNPLDSSHTVTALYNLFGSATSTNPIYTGNPQTVAWVDNSGNANFSANSTNGTSSERWQANASDIGQPVPISTSVTATYYDQLDVTFSATTASGGTTMTSSNGVGATYTRFGSSAQTGVNAIYDGHSFTDWVDRGQTATLSATSSGSNSIERWQANSAGTAPSQSISSTTFSATYYNQLNVTFSAATAAGGSAMTSSNFVSASYPAFGSSSSASPLYDGHSLTAWADRGGTATYSANSSSPPANERWQANSGDTQPTAAYSGTSTASATYYDQLKLTVTSTCGSNTTCGTPGSTGTAFGSAVASGGTTPYYDRGSTAHATLASATDTSNNRTYDFVSWSGDASGSGLTSSAITMSATRAATATWVAAITCGASGLAVCGGAPGNVSATLTGHNFSLYPTMTAYTVQDETSSGKWQLTASATNVSCTYNASTNPNCPAAGDTFATGSVLIAGPSAAHCEGTGTYHQDLAANTTAAIDGGASIPIAHLSGGDSSCAFTPGTAGTGNMQINVPAKARDANYSTTVTFTIAVGP